MNEHRMLRACRPHRPPSGGPGVGRLGSTRLERYLDGARQGRAALWVHVPDDADAKRAVRWLADHPFIHLCHYGQDRQQDLHLR